MAVALDAGHPHDLAAVHLQVYPVECGSSGPVDHGQVAYCQGDVVVSDPGIGGWSRELGSDHQLGQLVGGHVGRFDGCHGPTLPEHSDGVGDGQHLPQLVVDEDDRVALGLEFPEVPEQLLHLLGDEHRSGLVQDEYPCPPVEDLDDLDALAFTDLQGLDEVVGVQVEPVGGT